MDHAYVGGQQILDAIARNRVGVAAAKLHEAIAAIRSGLRRDAPREISRQFAVAIFIDVFHASAPSKAASRNSERVRNASSSSILASA